MNLKQYSYDITESECPDCTEGDLWVNSFELVCDECGRAFRNNENHEVANDHEDYQIEQRVVRYSSGWVILPGGFTEAYPHAQSESINDDPIEIQNPYK